MAGSLGDLINVIEAAYVLTGDELSWIRGITETALPRLCRGHGVLVQTYDASRLDRLSIRTRLQCGIDEHLVEATSKAGVTESEEAFLVPILRRSFVGNLRRAPEALLDSGMSASRVRDYSSGLDRLFREWGLVDQFWLNAQDPTYFGVVFVAPSKSRRQWQPLEREQWKLVASHVVTAFRIRRQFGDGKSESASPEERGAEAILRPDGRVEHAELPASGNLARASLHRAVRDLDQARGPLRRSDPQAALELWRGLVAGRWSLVDHFDSDGRRYILAHRNDAKVPDKRGLTLRERQVIAHAAVGHSNKVIAYELGLSQSTVATHLSHARAKLALASGAALAIRH